LQASFTHCTFSHREPSHPDRCRDGWRQRDCPRANFPRLGKLASEYGEYGEYGHMQANDWAWAAGKTAIVVEPVLIIESVIAIASSAESCRPRPQLAAGRLRAAGLASHFLGRQQMGDQADASFPHRHHGRLPVARSGWWKDGVDRACHRGLLARVSNNRVCFWSAARLAGVGREKTHLGLTFQVQCCGRERLKTHFSDAGKTCQ